MLIQELWRQARGDLAEFEIADEVLAGVGETDQPVPREWWARHHAQHLNYAWIRFDCVRADLGEVIRQSEAALDSLNGFLASIAICLRREKHEPLIELVDRRSGVRLPQVRLIGIYRHTLTIASAAGIATNRSPAALL